MFYCQQEKTVVPETQAEGRLDARGLRTVCLSCGGEINADWLPPVVRTLRSYAAMARFYDECGEDKAGEIEKVPAIPSPYAYSPTHVVWTWKGRRVIVVEIKHRCFSVHDVTAVPLIS